MLIKKRSDTARASRAVPDDAPAASDEAETPATTQPARERRRAVWAAAYGVLPAIGILLAVGAGWMKWQDETLRQAARASSESTTAAVNGTIAILSYRADTVDRDLAAAGERLAGRFRDSYATLINDVVIPGSKQKNISAVAKVAAASSVSATSNHAVVLVYVDQSTVIGKDPPTTTTSSVRVTLDKVGTRWLISDFTPI